ncbi:hypothetical protein NHX12_002698 [Muraenolepis orangiensis]|uniref:Uncharacterized protein n=1 Tax=Muraenolepis orangiensis TaxID=630683 RepID=A0A9Q0IEZ0_9TELE|nr:hypothetical protein NHX12_002698 [Muraenolepis orangiensis]
MFSKADGGPSGVPLGVLHVRKVGDMKTPQSWCPWILPRPERTSPPPRGGDVLSHVGRPLPRNTDCNVLLFFHNQGSRSLSGSSVPIPRAHEKELQEP